MGKVRRKEPTIFSVLISQHRTVEALFEQIEALSLLGDPAAHELIEVMRGKLLAHARAEEAVVYPRFAHVDALTHLIADAREQPTEIEILLGELSAMELGHPDFIPKLAELKDDVDHHVGEEEGKVFPRAQTVLVAAECEALAQEFLEEIYALTGEREAPEPVVGEGARGPGLIARMLGRH
jgi:hemerythrin superfamily protein